MGRAGPASFAESSGDISCALAPLLAKFEEAEPERDDAAEQVGVVAALITPLLVLGMGRGPVEFYADAVLLVEVVEIPVTCALPDPCLPGRRRKPVRAFHPAQASIAFRASLRRVFGGCPI